MDSKFEVMDATIRGLGKTACTWATECAERVRLACKHLMDLKLSGTPHVSPVLAELLEMAAVTNAEEVAENNRENLPIPIPKMYACELIRPP